MPDALSQKITRAEYIETYKDLAVKEMQRTGIPASITLAQGILESGDGNSTLARKGKNHFGIKCHSDWKGKKIYHDDDLKNECFRKYKSVYESYRDHSDFLTTRSRYQFLFDLELTDYKAWAKGLKKAGYATSRTYADALIRIIEENQLYKFDDSLFAPKKVKERKKEKRVVETKSVDYQLNNNIKCVYAKTGDNLEIIAQRHGKLPFELARYNEIERAAELIEGQIIYLQPKRKNASRSFNYHEVKAGETMHSISQKYGVKLKHLYLKNQMDEGSEPEVGQKLWLRKKKKGRPNLELKLIEPEEEEETNFEVEFEG
jgi:LysM repeat protein